MKNLDQANEWTVWIIYIDTFASGTVGRIVFRLSEVGQVTSWPHISQNKRDLTNTGDKIVGWVHI